MNVRRRTVMLASAFGTAWCLGAGPALALGRTPVGGSVKMRLPLNLSRVDPHDLTDLAAALFASALFDTLYALDARGRVHPALAQEMPTASGSGCVVTLRPHLRAASGAPLGARSMIASFERSKRSGGAAALSPLGPVEPVAGDRLAVRFPRASRNAVSLALSRAETALVPAGFRPDQPDGTGPFRAIVHGDRLELARNPLAARGGAFLKNVRVYFANSLTDSLRSFESEIDDLGWLGAGLHRDRPQAKRFDFGSVGWVVLATGGQADRFRAPGVAQSIADSLPRARLGHLGLGGLTSGRADASWRGPPGALIVDAQSPQLVEVARAVAQVLSGDKQHQLDVTPLPTGTFRRRRRSGDYVLAIDFVRRTGRSARQAYLSLLSVDEPARAAKAGASPSPFGASASARAMTASMRLGVIGSLRLVGATHPKLTIGQSAGSDAVGWSWREAHIAS